MCTGLEWAAVAAATAASVGGSVMANRQQAAAQRNYNDQTAQQNALLSQQFLDKNKLLASNNDAQNNLQNQEAAAQDAEFKNQTDLANKKAALFQDAVSAPGSAVQGTNSQAFTDSAANRMKLFTDANQPADYSTNVGGAAGGQTEDRVLRSHADTAAENANNKAGAIATAQSKIGALSDTGQSQNQLFRGLDTSLGDVTKESQAGTQALQSKLRLPEARIGQIGAASSAAAGTPYFAGPAPVYNTPNTLWSDTLKGIGQTGSYFGGKAMGKTAYNNANWLNPDTGTRVAIQ